MPFGRYYVSIRARLQHFPVALVVLWQDRELFVTGKIREADKQLRARNNGLVGAEPAGTHRMCQDSPQIARCLWAQQKGGAEMRPCTDGRAKGCLQRRTARSVRDTQCDSETAKPTRGFSSPVHGATVAFQAFGFSVSSFYPSSSQHTWSTKPQWRWIKSSVYSL